MLNTVVHRASQVLSENGLSRRIHGHSSGPGRFEGEARVSSRKQGGKWNLLGCFARLLAAAILCDVVSDDSDKMLICVLSFAPSGIEDSLVYGNTALSQQICQMLDSSFDKKSARRNSKCCDKQTPEMGGRNVDFVRQPAQSPSFRKTIAEKSRCPRDLNTLRAISARVSI